MKKPTVEQIMAQTEALERQAVEKHLNSLDESYFSRFDIPDIALHLEKIASLSNAKPVDVVFSSSEDGSGIECTVISFDHQGIFSLITGVFAASGFHIQSGETFTYRRQPPESLPKRRHYRRTYRQPSVPVLRPIIDHFRGSLDRIIQTEVWCADFRTQLQQLISLLFSGGGDGMTRARQRVNEMVTRYLVASRKSAYEVLYPVELEMKPLPEHRAVELTVVSQDTPAFLYTLSNTLALQGLSIDYVRIRTAGGRIEDVIEVSEPGFGSILKPETMEKLKLSVLLTKQFTYFLDRAPDPYAALTRFETLLPDILVLPDSKSWVDSLANPRTMDELAHVLGTSDFLWEDFIRLQYEMLLPILSSHLSGQQVFEPVETIGSRLAAAMDRAASFEESREILNEFKNRELFLIDLRHILDDGTNFRDLAEDLTCLAEAIVKQAAVTVYDHLVHRYGHPRTVAGLPASYALFGLGKLGGAALGYASDIELLLVYDDNGETDGEERISNIDFFSHVSTGISSFIVTKKKGIFAIDYRLRPYGDSGPLAVSLENFCRYYGPGGPAHSFERLALVRLRHIGGNSELGTRVERLRDQYVYESGNIDLQELRDLRRKQLQEKHRPGRYNAKFSPGALVDIEYSVQILQVVSRHDRRQLRTPRIHEALEALRDFGMLTDKECAQLNAAYDFLRQLINALRMLRGSAEDLFLPPVDADEFIHLARRMGYRRRVDLDAARQLMVDFATHTAIVRAFVERHLGRESLPAPAVGNIVDLIINEHLSEDRRRLIMAGYGFSNVDRACTNLFSLAGSGKQRDLFVKLSVLVGDFLRRESEPDLALNNLERFVSALENPLAHYRLLFSQPKRLEILLGIFSRSQFLANTLIRNPDFFTWVTTPEILYGKRTREQLQLELRKMAGDDADHDRWLAALRRFRRREHLRIGTCDLCLNFPFRGIVRDLSQVADAIIQETLERVWFDLDRQNDGLVTAAHLDESFCVFAFGKLGGRELNYSSDIDLLAVYDAKAVGGIALPDGKPVSTIYFQVMDRLRDDLTRHTSDGYVYRVDLRLRPYGQSGPLVPTLTALTSYYRDAASLWEMQAALKLRPVAGNLTLAEPFMQEIRRQLAGLRDRRQIITTVCHLREQTVKKQIIQGHEYDNVKESAGGIRDIEFLVQALQLIHAGDYPAIITGNTLEALQQLENKKILPKSTVARLQDDYILLRTIEHFLQIFEDQQRHLLPDDPREREALAKRIWGFDANPQSCMDCIQEVMTRVREVYSRYLQPDRPGDGSD